MITQPSHRVEQTHVAELAEGHLKVLQELSRSEQRADDPKGVGRLVQCLRQKVTHLEHLKARQIKPIQSEVSLTLRLSSSFSGHAKWRLLPMADECSWESWERG